MDISELIRLKVAAKKITSPADIFQQPDNLVNSPVILPRRI